LRALNRRSWARSCGAVGLVGLLLCLVIILPGAPTPKKQPYTTWSAFGGTADSMQYSALTQINKSNVSQIEQVWFYPLPGRAELAFSPLIVGKVMYVRGKRQPLCCSAGRRHGTGNLDASH
jgi:hypothetical protein